MSDKKIIDINLIIDELLCEDQVLHEIDFFKRASVNRQILKAIMKVEKECFKKAKASSDPKQNMKRCETKKFEVAIKICKSLLPRCSKFNNLEKCREYLNDQIRQFTGEYRRSLKN